MTWVGTNSTNIAVTQGGAADLLWVIKSALIEAGWRLMSFGGGASSNIYQAPNVDGVTSVTDTLTTAASLNVNGAWFRIKEPGTAIEGREYIFQRGDAATKLNVKYSRSSGFTGSNPTYPVSDQYSPTTGGGDGVSLFSTLSDSSVRASESVATTYENGTRVHCVASSTATSDGVWEFFALSTNGTLSTNPPTVIYQSALIPGSYGTYDLDPSFRGIGFINRLFTSLTSDLNVASFWHSYGSDASYVRYARVSQYYAYAGLASSSWPYGAHAQGRHGTSESSIYDNKPSLFPVGYVHAMETTSAVVPRVGKGMPLSMRVFTGAQQLGETFNLESNSPWVVANTNIMGLVLPWTKNIEPVF
jgi:hypothetical protein